MGWSNQYFVVCVVVVTFVAVCQAIQGPTELKVLNATSNSFKISWIAMTPLAGFNLTSYKVSAVPVKTYSGSPEGYEGTASASQSEFVLLGLNAATRYNLSIWATAENGSTTERSSIEAWTMLGEIPAMPKPTVERRTEDGKHLLKVQINPPTVLQELVKKYQIIAIEEDTLMSFSPEDIKTFRDADEAGLNYYLAGEVIAEDSSLGFTLGDRSTETNPALKSEKYDVICGAIFELNGEIRKSYSQPSTAVQKPIQSVVDSDQPKAESMRRRDAVLVFMLSVAIGILGFLLVASFILYFILRRQYNQKRRSDELILKIHDHNNDNTYFANGQLHLEEGADLNSFYSKLCDLYWQIPRPQLHIAETMLGQGTYGPVRLGKVLRNGKEIAAQVQRCGAHFALSDRDRRVLLADLEAMVRIGSHANVVEFIGGCEEGDALWMATEHPNNPLRGVLLASRQQQSDQRVCSIPEYRFMEIAISLADGMKHLSHRGVVHGYLSTRSIMVELPDMIPKISNFSLAKYTPLGKKLDYTRWTAPEAMRKRVTPKGDVWSFGVLLWELFTVGGTPYIDIKINEIQSRIAKGHRLAQPRGVDSILFQLMLHCWELDPDERPTFEELSKDLRSVASEDPFRLPRQSKYIFDKFDPLADES